ncbi:hypothetical protein V5J35_003695 [Endozoicomonas sp. NE40]|uniref:Uncharacterized protein n=1 Tax=Endozoicomonas lisbonensis TaxID=3120522 RepID=A0ABV2SNM6_9GAMM
MDNLLILMDDRVNRTKKIEENHTNPVFKSGDNIIVIDASNMPSIEANCSLSRYFFLISLSASISSSQSSRKQDVNAVLLNIDFMKKSL